VRKERGKFLPAEPAKKIIRSQRSRRGGAKGTQNLVSGVVTKGVVNMLESVEIKQQQHRRSPVERAPMQKLLATLEKRPAVAHTSEWINQRSVFLSENHPLSCHCAEKIGHAKRKEHSLEDGESPQTGANFLGLRRQRQRARKRNANDKECRMNKQK
jgi:hypothetical protein